MSFLSSLLSVFSVFTVSISNGFSYLPLTKIRSGAVFPDMKFAVNFPNEDGKFFLGQEYSSSNPLTPGSYQEQPTYQPGLTTPPTSFPTSQPNGYNVPLGMNEVSMYSASAECERHIKNYEGLRQRPYFVNGQKFIGYGHRLSKNDTTTYISRDQADTYLQSDIQAAVGTVKSAISAKLTQTQFDALVDFAFTMDASTFKSSNVVQKVNGGDIAGACTALMQWCYGEQNGVMARFEHLTSRRTGNVRWMSMSADPQPIQS
jgi:lysozyme